MKRWIERHPIATRWIASAVGAAVSAALIALTEKEGVRAHLWEVAGTAVAVYIIVAWTQPRSRT